MKTKKTTTSKYENRCLFDTDRCDGPLWECVRCGEVFCTARHGCTSPTGNNVECCFCVHQGQADSLPDVERNLNKLHGLSAQTAKLNFDK